ncbi:MAG: hypothetical protein AABZ55_13435 [Bdellovibrionota bacterium]
MNNYYLIAFTMLSIGWFGLAALGSPTAQQNQDYPQRVAYVCTCTTSINDKVTSTGNFKIEKPLLTENDSRAWTGCGPDGLSTLVITPNSIRIEIYGYNPRKTGKSYISTDRELPHTFRIIHAGSSEDVTDVSCEIKP